MSRRTDQPSLFCFGLGYSALALARALQSKGWCVRGTCRSEERRAELAGLGIESWLFDREHPLPDAEAVLADATHLLSAVPPDAAGDTVTDALGSALAQQEYTWVGYLSTTGVYGDRGGGWVDEES